jgi:hypothetical protein
MAILGQFPPNVIFLIGILRPVRWTIAAARSWSRPDSEPVATTQPLSLSKGVARKKNRSRSEK